VNKRASQRGNVRAPQLVGLLLALMLSWVLWSGIYKPLLLWLGLFSLPISPTMVELTTTEASDAGKVILGNSITLSPGTATIDVHKDRLLVHCLTRKSAVALLEQEAQLRTSRLEIS